VKPELEEDQALVSSGQALPILQGSGIPVFAADRVNQARRFDFFEPFGSKPGPAIG
jgi:hypothetical protein